MDRNKRAEVIREWISERKKKGQLTGCVLYITVPKYIKIQDDVTIRKVEAILDRNHVDHAQVDTVSSAYNLDREWVQTGRIDCVIEYCGVYPAGWEINDVVELERMEHAGEIIISVWQDVKGKYLPNN